MGPCLGAQGWLWAGAGAFFAAWPPTAAGAADDWAGLLYSVLFAAVACVFLGHHTGGGAA